MFRLGVLLCFATLVGSAMSAQAVAAAVNHQITRPGAAVSSNVAITVDFDQVPLDVAIRTIASRAGVRVGFAPSLLPRKQVSYRANNVSALTALTAVLAGTNLRVEQAPDGSLRIIMPSTERSGRSRAAGGTIVGKVTDAATKQPVTGATIQLEGTNRTVQTADDGTFRLGDVANGAHTVVVRRIGYGKVSRPVQIEENGSITIDVVLDVSANALEQIVVTGTIAQTELKAVPSAITVVTAKQIEERGITKIDQLFRGDIPGLFAMNQGSNAAGLLDEVVMFSRGATALSNSSVGTDVNARSNPIKVYIDGVELADPKYFSQVDPKNIDRIEILTGPQASTVYGSNAINGVMQIFTKRGITSRPTVSLSLLSGWVENDFSRARTPQHDYSAQLSGVENRLSYNASGSWNYMGPWTPAKQLTRTTGSGGARLEIPTVGGRVTTDMSLRRSITQNLQRGSVFHREAAYQETGWYAKFGTIGLTPPATSALIGQTLGLMLGYAPTNWWSHEVGVGVDVSDTEKRYTAPGYVVPADTVLFLEQNHADRRSLHYTTTARVPVTSFTQATVTVGADGWQKVTSFVRVTPLSLTGTLANVNFIMRQPDHNTGAFLQTQLGVNDRVFITYGLRAEWNPGFGKEVQPSYAPRYGVAYTQDIGAVTAKLRASYGRSTRPPTPRYKLARTAMETFGANSSIISDYGNFDLYRANSDLGPEYQQGGEGGLELYLGTRGSLVITRYNQTVEGLINNPKVDSVRSFAPCSSPCSFNSRDTDGYGYQRQYQYLNIGSIRNQGWELQGNVHLGSITTRGTYSWTKSRTIGVNPKYRTYFADQPQYQPGATFQFLPEHTWALGMTYANGASAVGLNVTGSGRATNLRDDFYSRYLTSAIRLSQNRLNATGRYIYFNPAYALADLTASHRFVPRVEGVVQVQNLADSYTNDLHADFATMGRQVKAGLRLSTR